MKIKEIKRIPAFVSAMLICSVTVCGQFAGAVDDMQVMPYNYENQYDYNDQYNDTEVTTDTGIQEDTSEPVTDVIPENSEIPTDSTENSVPVQSSGRKKASINDYDSSLSAVSYEFSYPEYTYEEDFSNYVNGQQYEQAKKDIIVSFRTANPVTSVGREDGADLTQVGHVGEIPVSHTQDVSSDMSGEFTFVTYGWGHGVGMSQNGADFYATYAGWSYQDILAHYYPNTYLMNTGLTDYEELTIDGEPAGDTVSVVAQIVNREIGGSMNYEAIKAQAVAVYTYLKYHNDDSADLLGKPDPPQVVIDACTDVLGEALYYNGSYALTMFSASTGGCTANCGEVFYADIPYLISVPSDYDEQYDPHYGTVTYYPASEVKRLIETEYNITLSDDPGKWIQPVYSQQTGYVTDVNIDDQLSIRGYELKLLLDLKSSKFNLTYTY